MNLRDLPFLIFDVEAIGIHGQAFAVAGGIYQARQCLEEFGPWAIERYSARGERPDREWVDANVPRIDATHGNARMLRDQFWGFWETAKVDYPGIVMAAECSWPVEARFLIECIADSPHARKWQGPYPLHDIASIMLAAGLDPMAKYPRLENELPEHHPLKDTRQSARLLFDAFDLLSAIPTPTQA